MSRSIRNPAGIGKGTGIEVRERDRDGIGLGHYRLRAAEWKFHSITRISHVYVTVFVAFLGFSWERLKPGVCVLCSLTVRPPVST